MTPRPRYVVLWVPNWPLASLVAGLPPGTPGALIRGGRVAVVTPAASRAGVRSGMARSLAQYNCPDLVLVSPDEEKEGSAFEALLEIFDRVAAGVTAVRPGLAFAPARSAAKWTGGEGALAEHLIEDIAVETGAECQVGIASGLSTALLAARSGLIVADSQTLDFLDSLSLIRLVVDLPQSQRDLVCQTLEVLDGLGVTTGLQLRQLGQASVVSRFGSAGQVLWNLILGELPHLDASSRIPSEVEVVFELDPPAEHADQAATAIARVSASMGDRLQQRALYSSTVKVVLRTASGRFHERTWTMFDATSSLQVAKRITWQVRGWLESGVPGALDGGTEGVDGLLSIRVVALRPQTRVEDDLLWGSTRASSKVGQSIEQVQSLLGGQAVVTPRLHGGFDPRTRMSLNPWGVAPAKVPPVEGEWEGAVEDPPVVLFGKPPTVFLMGPRADGILGPVWISRRGTLNGDPRQLLVQDGREDLPSGDHPLNGVVRQWVVRGRWWKTGDQLHGARCYLRVRRTAGPDVLLVQRKGQWYAEGIYAKNVNKGQW